MSKTKNPTARSTRTRHRTTPVFASKSDWARSQFDLGRTVSEVEHDPANPGMGYAFLYGIAKRHGVALTAANRRPTRAVSIEGDLVKVQTSVGMISVNRATGEVIRPKVKTPAKPKVETPAE